MKFISSNKQSLFKHRLLHYRKTISKIILKNHIEWIQLFFIGFNKLILSEALHKHDLSNMKTILSFNQQNLKSSSYIHHYIKQKHTYSVISVNNTVIDFRDSVSEKN